MTGQYLLPKHVSVAAEFGPVRGRRGRPRGRVAKCRLPTRITTGGSGVQMTLQRHADIIVLVVIGIFVGLMIADASTAEHLVSEWHTLIAGVLAVIAAT